MASERSLESLCFPVVALRPSDSTMYFFAQASALEATSEQLLRQGVFHGVEFVDAQGHVFQVVSVLQTGYRGLWGWNPFLKGRQVKVRFVLQELPPVALHAFKQALSGKVQASPQAVDKGAVLRAIHAATNFREIISLFK